MAKIRNLANVLLAALFVTFITKLTLRLKMTMQATDSPKRREEDSEEESPDFHSECHAESSLRERKRKDVLAYYVATCNMYVN